MVTSKYACLNGHYLKVENLPLEQGNRAFLYGDGLFETIHANGTIPQFLDLHLQRLFQGMKVLKMEIPDFFNEAYFARHISGVLTRNKCFTGARIRMTVFRNPGGLYTPSVNDVSYLIEGVSLNNDKYVLNQQGLTIDIFPDIKKPVNLLSQIKSTNALIFVLAGLHKKENNLDDSILLNERGNICESVSSNLFLVKDNRIITPATAEGCLPGIMRSVIIKMIESSKLKPVIEKVIIPKDLSTADELFLTNAINGIRWVLAFRQKRYYNRIAKDLTEMLNVLAFQEA